MRPRRANHRSNFEETAEEMRGFMQRVEVDFSVLLDSDGAASHAWGVLAFPSSFLIDHQGRVRYSVDSAIAWDEEDVVGTIETLIAESAQQHGLDGTRPTATATEHSRVMEPSSKAH